jgi:uncharacterized protein YndB with AHSA1/START domain
MTSAVRLTGRIRVALPPAAAFVLFTPRGEQDWAPGWQPRFPSAAAAGETADDTEPGTVFLTSGGTGPHAHHATWLVTAREPGKRIAYARVMPGHQAGTVTVDLEADGDGSEVEVSYQLTALSPAADRGLAEFATGYAAYLQSWEDAITALLTARRAGTARRPGHRSGTSTPHPC